MRVFCPPQETKAATTDTTSSFTRPASSGPGGGASKSVEVFTFYIDFLYSGRTCSPSVSPPWSQLPLTRSFTLNSPSNKSIKWIQKKEVASKIIITAPQSVSKNIWKPRRTAGWAGSTPLTSSPTAAPPVWLPTSISSSSSNNKGRPTSPGTLAAYQSVGPHST